MPQPDDHSAGRAPERPANRLIHESSPYLLQHAHNPVDWYPWGDEAFAEARRRDVPIFLSIGYSTCYWCHVMERESFENEAIAKIMNEHFVNIKVDREQRPDIDEVYMAATVIMTGHGGWPMSCFLEPEHLRPFWCGTYFPAEPRADLPQMPTFPQILRGISAAWREQREQVLQQGEQVARAVREQLEQAREPVALSATHIEQAIQGLLRMFDRVHGGFGSAPKFPQPVFLEFLLDARGRVDGASRSAIDEAVRLTLDRMGVGGIFDQVAGGFHRYSVDATWTVPHFEKMLYDQAQLARVYARAARVYDDAFYARIARRTCGFVLRELRDEAGGFHSALDAEVDGREGLNYLWTPEEIREALDPEDADLAIRVYQLDAGPNFRDPHHSDEPPRNVLRMRDRPDRLASDLGMDADALIARLNAINTRLLKVRDGRKGPRRDDKVLTGWNGLMIAALADVGRMLDEPSLIEHGARAARFVLEHLRKDGTLLRSWRRGQTSGPGFLEDGAFLLDALESLRRAGAAGDWQDAASEVLQTIERDFGDGVGGFFDTRADQTDLFVRTRSVHDGAIPSAVGVLALVLAQRGGDDAASAERAARTLHAVSGSIDENPLGATNSLRALMLVLRLDLPETMTDWFASSSRSVPVEPAGPANPAFTPVEVLADHDRVVIARDEPAMLTLRLRIAPDWHLIAPDTPDASTLVPVRVHTLGGTGMRVYAEYPPGEQRPDGLRVYADTVDIPVALERVGRWSGRPMLGVTYQACSQTECLQVRTVELDVAIDARDPDDDVPEPQESDASSG